MRYLDPFLASAIFMTALILSSAAPAQTVVSATLTDLADEGAGDLWRIDYSLDADFLYDSGSALTVSLPQTTTFSPDQITWASCGWSGAYLFRDPSLLSEEGLDQLATDEICPGNQPSRDLGGLRFIWTGTGNTPAETHRLVVYDSNFQVIETSTVQVPEPTSDGLAFAAFATLLWVTRSSRHRGRRNRHGITLSICLAACVAISAAPIEAAEPVEGMISHSFNVGNYEVVLEPTEFQRTGQFTFVYTFDLSVTNAGVATGTALLAIGTSQTHASVTDGLIALPAMAMNQTLTLDPVKLAINRQQIAQFASPPSADGTLFDPGAIVLCAMPEPVLGMSLPESDPAVATIDQFATSCADPNFSDPNWKLGLPPPPKVAFTKGLTYSWSMFTNQGTMKFQLLPDHAPHHVAAIIYLVRLGFYDGLSFHRVVQNFVAQGGDPLGTGAGGPGYSLAGEFDAAATHDGAGILSTAHSGPVTDGSQFFITFVATPFLDGIHTIPGRLVEGSTVLDAIHALAAAPNCGSSCAPSSPITIVGGSISVE